MDCRQMLRNSCFLGTLWLACCAAAMAADSEPSGRELFDRQWRQNDSLSRGGDGLGPMFNARSCAACHHLRDSGGAGDNTHNVDLLTLVDFKTQDDKPPSRRPLERLHPGFNTANSVTLHTFSTQPNYETYRLSLLGREKSRIKSIPIYLGPAGHSIHWDTFLLQKSQRNTPSLFGAGAIDKISDQALSQLASRGGGPNRLIPGSNNRFGWKAQTKTLRDFVRGACANELGLQTAESPQPADPMRASYRNKQMDMTESQIGDLVKFVASLPPPKQLEASDAQEAAALQRGSALFKQAGCLTCHVARIEHAVGIYSDLQLHDMGVDLSEPVGRGLSQSTPSGGRAVVGVYYGPTVEQIAASWRTPPLWGVRHTAPYMHDGRAATLDQAIKMHGGEAAESAEMYKKMSEKQRSDLRAFVRSLGAP